METFSALLAICVGNSPVPGEFPAQRPVTRSFGVFFDLHPNKLLSKQLWGWWFEMPSCPLWRHRNALSLVLLTESSVGTMWGIHSNLDYIRVYYWLGHITPQEYIQFGYTWDISCLKSAKPLPEHNVLLVRNILLLGMAIRLLWEMTTLRCWLSWFVMVNSMQQRRRVCKLRDVRDPNSVIASPADALAPSSWHILTASWDNMCSFKFLWLSYFI